LLVLALFSKSSDCARLKIGEGFGAEPATAATMNKSDLYDDKAAPNAQVLKTLTFEKLSRLDSIYKRLVHVYKHLRDNKDANQRQGQDTMQYAAEVIDEVVVNLFDLYELGEGRKKLWDQEKNQRPK